MSAHALHDHEEWQVREASGGGHYCVACGDTVRLDAEVGYWKTTV